VFDAWEKYVIIVLRLLINKRAHLFAGAVFENEREQRKKMCCCFST